MCVHNVAKTFEPLNMQISSWGQTVQSSAFLFQLLSYK